MGKKCYKCGFSDNPDNANFCGKCGNKLSLVDDWKLYNARQYCLVELYVYDYIVNKELKAKYERTFFQRILDWFYWFFNNYIIRGIFFFIVSLIGLILFFKSFKEEFWFQAICEFSMFISSGYLAYSYFKDVYIVIKKLTRNN